MCICTVSPKFGGAEPQYIGVAGYSLRSERWRYNIWCRWNGTALAPVLPHLYSGVPRNGTHGFYNELFEYDPAQPNNFAAMDTAEVASQNHAVVAKMHQALVAMI
jgi:hypothetical protein